MVVRRSSLGRPWAQRPRWRGDRPWSTMPPSPSLLPTSRSATSGPRRLPTALLLPPGAADGTPLPVLLDPYGGPHAQRVLRARGAYLSSQWFADQGFAVVVVDGRGTPGRGSAWERGIHRDLAGPVLEDQLDGPPRSRRGRAAARPVPRGHPRLELRRLPRRARRRCADPTRVHAAIAGAPVTDWRLYDTFYTERYLGQPRHADADAYERSSVIADAAKLERPLLLVHGLADDNVVSAHTLQLSSALLAPAAPTRCSPHRRHPHGVAGGGRREPLAPPARLPPHALG